MGKSRLVGSLRSFCFGEGVKCVGERRRDLAGDLSSVSSRSSFTYEPHGRFASCGELTFDSSFGFGLMNLL